MIKIKFITHELQGAFKIRLNFLNSAPTSKESALRLLSAPNIRFWQQTAICPVSLWALVVELHLLNWARAYAVRRIFLTHLYGLETTSFQTGFKFGKTGKSLPGLSPRNRVDGAQWMSDVLPDNSGWGATREQAHCRGKTSKSGFPTNQVSFCALDAGHSMW